ncbi:hypothetical protein E8E11_003270 [Didymella keratinophila]|nr:hypothetical protein E8E11_003270 [Didymella keratinophila]
MAELLGLVASVVQVAGAGIQLLKTLYDYVDGVATADRSIKDVAAEIKLRNILKHEETASLVSKKAVKTTNDTITECSTLFAQIDATLKKSKKNTFGRLTLPFRDTKLEPLRSHVDKLKSTLQLLMQVFTYAYQVASRKLNHAAEERQREEIKRLLEQNEESRKRHDELLRKDSAGEDNFSSSTSTGRDISQITSSAGVSIASAVDPINTADALATCMDQFHSLLHDIEALQEALNTNTIGTDHSAHHHALMGSYVCAREGLDQLLFGSPKRASLLKQLTGDARGYIATKSAPTPKAGPAAAWPVRKAAPSNSKADRNVVGKATWASIVAEETMVDPSELVDNAGLEDSGMDSLLAFTISERFREELMVNVSFIWLTDYPTVAELKAYFVGKEVKSGKATPSDEESPNAGNVVEVLESGQGSDVLEDRSSKSYAPSKPSFRDAEKSTLLRPTRRPGFFKKLTTRRKTKSKWDLVDPPNSSSLAPMPGKASPTITDDEERGYAFHDHIVSTSVYRRRLGKPENLDEVDALLKEWTVTLD